jgi:hypothetical protein
MMKKVVLSTAAVFALSGIANAENIAKDILSLVEQVGVAAEATAKLGDVSTKRLAVDNINSFEKERLEIIKKHTMRREDGSIIRKGQINHQALIDDINALKQKYYVSFDTQRQQDIYDSIYTNPVNKVVLNLIENIYLMQHNNNYNLFRNSSVWNYAPQVDLTPPTMYDENKTPEELALGNKMPGAFALGNNNTGVDIG